MLIVTGLIEIDPANIDAAKAAALDMMTETHKEDGCFVYEFSQQLDAPHRFRVYEEWRDGAALKAHSKSAHMAVFRAALEKVGVTSRDIAMFDGGEKTAI